MNETNDRENYTTRLKPELYDKLRKLAFERNCAQADIIEEALKKYFS